MAICRSCEAEIIWAETVTGRLMPLDAAPVRDGNMVFINGQTRPASAEDRRLRRPLYKSHFATCPQYKDWRRR